MRDGKADTTLYVIAYDMSSDKRRSKVHKTLCGYGDWTQFSLFECYLSEKQLVALRHKLDQHLEKNQDSVRYYPLCGRCAAKVEAVGSKKPEETGVYIV